MINWVKILSSVTTFLASEESKDHVKKGGCRGFHFCMLKHGARSYVFIGRALQNY